MAIADITLAAFTLCNSLRVVAYLPQIARAARDRSGAEAISVGTWGLFLVSWVGSGLCARQPTGLDDGVGISGQRRWLWCDPPDCRLETLPISPPADRNGFTRTLPKTSQTVAYSITSSARASSVGGTSRPSAWAVLGDASHRDRRDAPRTARRDTPALRGFSACRRERSRRPQSMFRSRPRPELRGGSCAAILLGPWHSA